MGIEEVRLVGFDEAIREIEQSRCERIAAPGKWKVWRAKGPKGEDQVKHEVTAK